MAATQALLSFLLESLCEEVRHASPWLVFSRQSARSAPERINLRQFIFSLSNAFFIHFFCETFACINLVIFNYAFHFVPLFSPSICKDEKAGKMQQVFLFFQIFALFSMFSYFPLRFYTCKMVRKNPVIVVITGFRWCGWQDSNLHVLGTQDP